MTKSDASIPTVVAILIGALSLLLTQYILLLFGRNDLVLDNALEVGAYLLILPVVLFLGFLFNCFRAAPEIDNELQLGIGALEKKIDDREARQSAIDVLWQLRSDGISMLNEVITERDDFLDWQNRFNQWRSDTLQAARTVDINLHNWLERLHKMSPHPGNIQPFNNEHGRLLSIQSEILDRVIKYLLRSLLDVDR